MLDARCTTKNVTRLSVSHNDAAKRSYCILLEQMNRVHRLIKDPSDLVSHNQEQQMQRIKYLTRRPHGLTNCQPNVE
jgi:hypothetical protein